MWMLWSNNELSNCIDFLSDPKSPFTVPGTTKILFASLASSDSLLLVNTKISHPAFLAFLVSETILRLLPEPETYKFI